MSNVLVNPTPGMLAAWSNEDIMQNVFISETCAMDEPPLKMQKLEQNGKILYLVWPPDGRPPILLNCQMRAQEFLEKENLLSVVPLSRFDFKKPTSENSSPSLPSLSFFPLSLFLSRSLCVWECECVCVWTCVPALSAFIWYFCGSNCMVQVLTRAKNIAVRY